ncbi:DUF2752 domain-containing protein [Fulvivirgaceae bacterium BMA10]|uniref:DUF2752 domain-containing protein n=1 Tax=Splendidivirga corallicola TaxID=3051826 RepID=A0ABT8KKS5_9BACT|nr:DUF2752 domain-containing protein [Fulvivirgaceae bacterium BMA10]
MFELAILNLESFLKIRKYLPLEGFIWLIGLICLAFFYPGTNAHFTLCFFHHLGFEFCPGCGLGRSIAYFLHGEISRSLYEHPLGIMAFLVLCFRIIQLFKQSFNHHYFKKNGKNH